MRWSYREVAVALDLSNVEMECRACGVAMKASSGGGGSIRYFRCPRCRRWVSSPYADVLRSDSQFQARPGGSGTKEAPGFEAVKSRLERWLAALDEQDPYRTLGISPMATDAQVRSRFKELALCVHPDRGGSPEQMREVNLAYERILQHRARRAAEAGAPPALVAATPSLTFRPGG